MCLRLKKQIKIFFALILEKSATHYIATIFIKYNSEKYWINKILKL